MKLLVLAAAGLALSVPARATEPTQPEEAAAASGDTGEASAAADQNRLICRRIESTGSRLSSKKVCQTAAKWQQDALAAREHTEKVQSSRWKLEKGG